MTITHAKRFVYVIQSVLKRERYYVGLTSDVAARLAAHNDGRSLHSAKHRPWRLLVSFEFADPLAAAAFERYLKSGSGRAFSRRHFGGAQVEETTVAPPQHRAGATADVPPRALPAGPAGNVRPAWPTSPLR